MKYYYPLPYNMVLSYRVITTLTRLGWLKHNADSSA